jgi:hypothetical protein
LFKIAEQVAEFGSHGRALADDGDGDEAWVRHEPERLVRRQFPPEALEAEEEASTSPP